jgi:hypothetical protein
LLVTNETGSVIEVKQRPSRLVAYLDDVTSDHPEELISCKLNSCVNFYIKFLYKIMKLRKTMEVLYKKYFFFLNCMSAADLHQSVGMVVWSL